MKHPIDSEANSEMRGFPKDPSEKNGTHYLSLPAVKVFLSRIPWLLFLMLSATFTGVIISAFEDALSVSVYLTAFIPMLMDTGGNAGNQAAVTVIRALSLGEIGSRDLLRVLKKEAVVAFLCASVLAFAAFFKVLVVDYFLLRTLSVEEAAVVPTVVALTLFFTALLSKLIGATLPLAAKRIGLDPAVMASPFITTIVDTLSLTVYFETARLLIPGL